MLRGGLLAALATVTVACSSRRAVEDEPPEPAVPPTVLVVNSGMSPLRIYVVYANQPRLLGTVQPGGRGCFVLPFPTRTYNLAGRGLDGSAISPPFVPATADGWIWELARHLTQDAISLRPRDGPCEHTGRG